MLTDGQIRYRKYRESHFSYGKKYRASLDKTKPYGNKKTCEWCGIDFLDKFQSRKRFCSKKCFGLSRRKRTTIKCLNCGKEFDTYRCRIGIKKYCSMVCKKQGFKGHNNPLYRGGKYRKCMECGKRVWRGNELCQSCSHKGERSHRWRGGITPVNTAIRLSNEMKLFRLKIHKRDHYKCVFCGSKSEQIDHIKPFSMFPELRFDEKNARAVCKKCHRLTETYGKTRPYFESLYSKA